MVASAVGAFCAILLTFLEVFSFLPGLRDAEIKSDEARRESHRQSNRPESIIAAAPSGYKARRSVLKKNGTDASSKQAA
jgi:hypothetical protein